MKTDKKETENTDQVLTILYYADRKIIGMIL